MRVVLTPLHTDFVEWFENHTNSEVGDELTLQTVQGCATKYYGQVSPMFYGPTAIMSHKKRQSKTKPRKVFTAPRPRSRPEVIRREVTTAKHRVLQEQKARQKNLRRASGFVNDALASAYGNGFDESQMHNWPTSGQEIHGMLSHYNEYQPTVTYT